MKSYKKHLYAFLVLSLVTGGLFGYAHSHDDHKIHSDCARCLFNTKGDNGVLERDSGLQFKYEGVIIIRIPEIILPPVILRPLNTLPNAPPAS